MNGSPAVSPSVLQLARFLSHDEFRSGEAIAHELDCSRTAVWKQVQGLRQLGLGVQAEAGRGYRLDSPLELLDDGLIRRFMKHDLESVQVVTQTGSTNADLLARPAGERHAHALLAECQVAGRGRRGRTWVSPFGRNIYLSLGWRFDQGLAGLTFLPLVVALAAARAVTRLGLEGHRIKWPNDLLLDGRKLAGCLVEIRGDINGPCHAVLGIGMNVHMRGAAAADEIDRDWTDLGSCLDGVSRNRVAAALLDELVEAVGDYQQNGFESFRAEWNAADALCGREITLATDHGNVKGIARGLGEAGGLLLETQGQVSEFQAGEVTLAAAKTA